MSDHLEMSGESSLDKNFQIRTNNEGDNELYIPCWEEEASSSTQYHHLIEETKFFKNKCRHLENHLEENHREFSSLNQLYMIAEANERRLLKQNEDLRKNNRDLITELSQTKIMIDSINNQLHAISKREVEAREKLVKSKEKQRELASEIQELRSEGEQLRRKNNQGIFRNEGQEQKWKKYYNEQIAKIQQQWKAAYQQIQSEFDRKSKEVREKMEEIKNLNKNCNAHKQDYQLRIKALQGEVQQSKRGSIKLKSQLNDYQRQIKDIKLVRDEVSSKNDEIQNQNSKLKAKIKQQSLKNNKLQSNYRELVLSFEEKDEENNNNIAQLNNCKLTINQLKNKIISLDNRIKEIQSQKDRLQVNKNYADNANHNLRQEITGMKNNKQIEVQSLRRDLQVKVRQYQGRIKDYEVRVKELQERARQQQSRMRQLKQQRSNQKSALETSISTLRQQIEQLKRQKRDSSTVRINQLQDQISILKEDIISWRSKYDRLNTKYRQEKSQCNHEAELIALRQDTKKLSEQNRMKRQLIEDLALRDQQSKKQKKKLMEQKQTLKNRLCQQNDSLKRQRDTLTQNNRQLLQRNKNDLNMWNIQNNERIAQLQEELQSKQQEIQRYKLKIKEDIKQTDKDKGKKYQNRIKEKQREIKTLEERIQELENQYEEQRIKNKTLEKDSRVQINKKQRKIKDLESNTETLKSELENIQLVNENNQKQIETLKKQNKQLHIIIEKLKAQLAKQQSYKQTLANQQANNNIKNKQKQRSQWDDLHQKLKIQLKTKDDELSLLKNRIDALSMTVKPEPSINNSNSEMQSILKRRIKELEQQLKSKEQVVKRYESLSRKDDQIAMGSLQQLQAEYNRQLLALKRLIMYKGYKQDENKKIQQLKSQYEGKIQFILSDYKTMHQEMMILKEKIINQRVTLITEPIDINAVQEIWRIKLQQISEERQVLIQKVAMWERKYEQLRYLFEAKIESKQQTINLLNLKLNNLQMSRPNCQYSCHHR